MFLPPTSFNTTNWAEPHPKLINLLRDYLKMKLSCFNVSRNWFFFFGSKIHPKHECCFRCVVGEEIDGRQAVSIKVSLFWARPKQALLNIMCGRSFSQKAWVHNEASVDTNHYAQAFAFRLPNTTHQSNATPNHNLSASNVIEWK